jgi:hypothetical protein
MRRAVLVVIVLTLSCSASAFDGHRKGLVFGGGIGISPLTIRHYYSTEYNFGLADQILVGYAPDDRNLIAYEINGVEYLSTNHRGGQSFTDNFRLQGFTGFTWYHFNAHPHSSMFVMFGLGTYTITAKGREAGSWSRLAGEAGIGHSLSSHALIGGYLAAGNSPDGGGSIDYLHVSVLLTYMVF